MQGLNNTGSLVRFLLGIASSKACGQAVGFIAVLTIIWFAGHLIGLHSSEKKLIAMAAVLAVFVVFMGIKWLYNKRSGDKLVTELANHNAGSQAEVDEIKQKMQDVLQSLKTSYLGAGHHGNAALYALPWYMVIGPSASGKSTLFANSGLHFPYTNANPNELHVQGFGGTRNCDWWFCDQAVLIDTAGRYTTESQDKQEWLSFLGLLKKHRPKLPINGVLVAISVGDILLNDAENLSQQVKIVRERIQQLITELGLIFPVHLVFTKSDMISGFEPFFADLTGAEVDQIWGAYLLDESEDQSQNPAELFELRMQGLYQTLCQQRLAKLARERNIHRKALIFDFPEQFKAAALKLTKFVNLLFKQNPYQEVPWFAGVYFTSGTQEGTPVERMLAGTDEQFCSVALVQKQESITKSYFINRFFNDVVFRLQDLTRGNRRQRKIQAWLKGLTISAMLASIGGVCALLMTSYTLNMMLISSGESKVQRFLDRVVATSTPADRIEQFLAVFEHYSKLLDYEQMQPWHLMFGVYEADETLAAVQSITFKAMQGIIAMPIQHKVASRLEVLSEQWSLLQDMDDKNALRQEYYRLLKLQLMFSNHPQKIDQVFAKSALLAHWQDILAVDLEDEALSTFAKRLDAVLHSYIANMGIDKDKPGALPYWQVNQGAIDRAREQLATLPEPAPLYQQIIASKAAKKPALSLLHLLPQSNRSLFVSQQKVDYAYTKEGWQSYVYPEINRVVSAASSGDWVMGSANEFGENLVDKDKAKILEQAIRALYFKDYANAWFEFLQGLEVRSFNSMLDASNSLAKLSAADGPIATLMAKINNHIILPDRPREMFPDAGKQEARLVNQGKFSLPDVSIKRAPEIERTFADLRRFTHSGKQGKSTDFLQQYISTLSTLHSDIKTLVSSSNIDAHAMKFSQQLLSGNETQSGLQSSWIVVDSQLRALEPVTKRSLDKLLKSALRSSFKAIAVVARKQLDDEWHDQVYALYKTGIKGKYPFSSMGPDAALADVAELLNDNTGILWSFVKQQLAPFLRSRKGKWQERTWNDMGIGFNHDLLSGLVTAKRVTRSLFSKGGEHSQFQFQMLPIAQAGIREIYLGFSEQSYRYRNEPEEWRKFTWPGQGSTEVARVYAIDRSGKRVGIEESGPWALLRVLNQAQIKWLKGTEYVVNWPFKKQNSGFDKVLSAKFNLKSGRHNGFFSKKTMTSFTLPLTLFEGLKSGHAKLTTRLNKDL